MGYWIFIFLFSFMWSYALIPIVSRIAAKYNLVDMPGARKVHVVPKPRIGGIAIYISFILTVYVFGILVFPALNKAELTTILIAGTIIFAMGLYDDIRPLSARFKLCVQIAVAVFLVYSGVKITLFVSNPLFVYAVSILWVVGITNSFNLLDNMDGLSSGIAIIASAFFFFVQLGQGKYETALFALAISGACLGFLRYNFNPSSIFMGDCGSTFIGFILSTIAMSGSYVVESRLRHLPVIIPLLILAVPIFDTVSVIFIRWRLNESIFKADKRHFSHRLTDLGMSHRTAVLFIYLVSVCVGLNSLIINSINRFQAIIILMQSVIVFVVIVILMLVGRKVSGK